MMLFINTSVENKLILAVKKGEDIMKKEVKMEGGHAEKFITALDKFLSEHKIYSKEIEGIIAVNGPGKFTSIRAGISAANVLAFALKKGSAAISADASGDLKNIFHVSKNKFKKHILIPFYGREPNITLKK
ncbi:MAG: hypothetical protein V1860_01770 [bacterium]